MATIFRFIVEDKATKALGNNVAIDANGVAVPKKGAGVKNVLGTGTLHNGVEHNRYMRAVNPVINRYTGGMWEKGVRLKDASIGASAAYKTGGLGGAVASVGGILIAQFIIMEATKMIEKAIKDAKEDNQANYVKLRTGNQIMSSSNYSSIRQTLFGKVTYASQ
jgi:hypothetical protein